MANLLRNGDFSQGTYRLVENGHEVNECEIPNGWTFTYAPSTGPGVMHRPETKIATVFNWRVWKAFSTFSTHQYTISQAVPVVPGMQYRLSAEVRAWSSKRDDGNISEGDNEQETRDLAYYTAIGVDEVGTTWNCPLPGLNMLDRFYEHNLEFTAKSSLITVRLRGEAKWRVKHNDTYWRGAWLEPIGGEPDNLAARVTALENWARELSYQGT